MVGAEELLQAVADGADTPETVEEKDPPVGSQIKERVWFAGRTPSGKGIQYRRSERSGNYVIEFMEGGQVPAELTGEWTKPHLAQTAIDEYLSKRD